jgi:hypothetical protein
MQGSAPFLLNRSGMLLALISAAFAGEAAAVAARVDFTTPGVTVAGRDGRQRPLARGTQVDSGDTVRTGADGRVQLRFTDGSYVSLQPNTDFAISDYKYEGKSDDRGFFGLVRGAMRTVTGAVGRVNRNSYRITTPTATVGIRGTGGVIQILPDGGTLVIGTSGVWSLTNPAGSIDIPAGISGLAPTEPNAPPRETGTQPQTSTAPVQTDKTTFVQGNEVNSDGTAVIGAPTKLVSGGGFHGTAFWSPNTSSASSFSNGGVDAIFDDSGRLTEFKDAGGTLWKSDNGTHANFGTDGIIAWGRWTGNVTTQGMAQTYSASQGMHYVIGTPTAAMPTGGGTANYTLAGATQPTYASGLSGPGTFSGSLTVTFNASPTVGLNYSVSMPDGSNYVVNQTIMGSGAIFSGTASGNPSNGAFIGTTGGCTGGATSCSSFVQGFFAGASAERAGVGYHIHDIMAGKHVIGTAAFKK